MYQPTPRVRSRSSFTPYYNVEGFRLCNGSVSGPTQSRPDGGYNFVGNGEDETTSDSDSADFYKFSRDGGIAVNPFSSTKRKFTAASTGGGSWSLKSGTGCPTCTGTLVASGYTDGDPGVWFGSYAAPNAWPSDSSLITDAGTKAYANVVEPTWASLVTLAELRETIGFLKSPLASLQNLGKAARRREGVDLFDILDSTAGTWLAYRYAISPLYGEIQSIMEVLQKKYSNRVERFTARGAATATRTPQASNVVQPAPASGGWRRDIQSLWTRTVSVRAGVLYEHNLDLGTDTGFRMQEIPSAAWEAITLSFVADWILNLGDYIRAISPKLGVRELCSWTTVKTTDQWQRTQWRTPVNTGGCGSGKSSHTFSGNPGYNASITTESLVRTPGIDVGIVLRTEQLDLDLARDQKRLVDALALVWTIFGGSKLVRKGIRMTDRSFTSLMRDSRKRGHWTYAD